MSDLYTDNDPFVCRWLEHLIAERHLPDGTVNEACIKAIKPKDLEGYERVHFFAGIGGWAYALELAGWPRGYPVWTGSCPCQPFSAAGKRKGEKDSRHLWPDWFRLIRQCRPAIIFGEQVSSDDGYRWLAGVFADLEAEGYSVGAADLPACGVGAPHRRYRLYWVANATHTNGRSRECGTQTRVGTNGVGRRGLASNGPNGCVAYTGDSKGRSHGPEQRQEGRTAYWRASQTVLCSDGKSRRISSEPAFFPLVARIPGRMGMLRGAGNSIVPQLAAKFIQATSEALTTGGRNETP